MFSKMANLTKLCTAMPNYDQHMKSQHGIHKLKIVLHILSLNVGLHVFELNVGPLALVPQKTRL